jgi:hypothetical protein
MGEVVVAALGAGELPALLLENPDQGRLCEEERR